jgi:hypothetical protein
MSMSELNFLHYLDDATGCCVYTCSNMAYLLPLQNR